MPARKRDLVGRTIVAIDWRRRWDAERRRWYADPLVSLDNGRRIWFVALETDCGEYGVEVCVSRPDRRKEGA